MATKRVVKPTLKRYSIVNRENGNRENIKDVVLTYYHNNVVELLTISADLLVYELNKVEIEKY